MHSRGQLCHMFYSAIVLGILSASALAADAPAVAASIDEQVKARQAEYDAARGPERSLAGEALIDALLEASRAKAAARAYADALDLAKRAMVVAIVVKSERQSQVTARVKTAGEAARAAPEAAALRKQLEAAPQDTATREKLVRLLLVCMDDPTDAATVVEGVADEALRKYVPAAAKGVDAAPELACVALGDWYRTLADATPGTAKVGVLERARAYYARFLELHEAEDEDRARVTLALKQTHADLAKLGLPLAAPPAVVWWIDLLPKVDLEKDVASGKWRHQGEGVAVDPVQGARLAVPMLPQGDYELEVKFTRTAGDDMVGVVLIVGGTQVVLNLGGYHGKASGLEFVKGERCDVNETKVPLALENGRSYKAVAKVVVRGEAAEVSTRLDGRPIMKWKGPVASLSIPSWFKLPSTKSLGLATWETGITYESVRLRMLSGEAKPLRADDSSS